MISIPLVENSLSGKATYLEHCAIPLFCMEDYTILGFAAANLPEAKKVLQKTGFHIQMTNGGAEIIVDNIARVSQLAELFIANHIEVSYMDIADTLYQA